MKLTALFGVTAAAVALMAAAPAMKIPANDAAAVGDTTRPEADTKRDADRHPAEMLALAGVKPGDTVVDLIPGGGYFTRLFSAAVGPKGAVYAFMPAEFAKFSKTPLPATGSHPDPVRANVTFLTAPINDFAVPAKADVVWTSQNYHDLHDSFTGPADMAKVNKAVFDALKPGGVYVVLDHSAEKGSGLRDTDTLHRIDEAAVKAEVEKAGFKLESTSDILRNPADPRTANVFKPEIRGHTDQFILKFRKPK